MDDEEGKVIFAISIEDAGDELLMDYNGIA
jgi:hypothetical protein